MSKSPGKKGFTLVETIVSLAIFGGLAANVAVPAYLDNVDRSQRNVCLATRRVLEDAEQRHIADHGKRSESINDLISSGYVKSLPSCPAGGVYAWDPRIDPSGVVNMVCSRHGDTSVDAATLEVPGLVAGWNLGEGSGALIGAGSFEGRLTGGEWVPGKIGQGIAFDDRSRDELVIGPTDGIHLSEDMTVSMWVRLDSSPTGKESLFTCNDRGERESDNTLYELFVGRNGKLFYKHEYDNGRDEKHTFRDTGVLPGEWNLVTMTRDNTNREVNIFVNGEQVGNWNYENPPTGGDDSRLYFGTDRASARRSIDGTIDEMSIYDRPLSPREIKDHYVRTR